MYVLHKKNGYLFFYCLMFSVRCLAKLLWHEFFAFGKIELAKSIWSHALHFEMMHEWKVLKWFKVSEYVSQLGFKLYKEE